MNQGYRISYKKPGPIGQAISFIVGVIALGLAAFLGFFVLAALAGVIAIAVIIFAIRVWWIRRQIDQAVREGKAPGEVVQGEFIVIEEITDEPREHR